MTTRAVAQLQEGHNHLDSVKNQREGLTFTEVYMLVLTLHARTEGLFPNRTDQDAYRRAVEKLREHLARASRTQFSSTGGNQFRETFQATRDGKRRTYRIDIEVSGRLAPP